MPDNENSRESVLSKAYDEMQAATEAPAPEPAVVEAAPEPVKVESAETDAPKQTERARDEAGRFTKSSAPSTVGDKAAGDPAAVEGKGAAAVTLPSQAAAAPALPEAPKWKPPQSWKPNVREKWASLPPEVQEEADRLDKEYQRILRDSAESKKAAGQVREMLTPYEPIARAAGMDPMRWVGSIAQTASALHIGAPAQKAQIVANLINTYGIDLEAINAHLQGQPTPAAGQAPQNPVDIQAEIDRRIQQRIEMAETAQLTNRAKQAMATARQKSEFWDDLGGDAKIVPLAAALVSAGHYDDPEVALGAAYEMLAQRSPEVSAVLKQRQEAEAAKARAASTQQAKAAASSIKSQPAAVGEAKPVGRMAALEAGWRKHVER